MTSTIISNLTDSQIVALKRFGTELILSPFLEARDILKKLAEIKEEMAAGEFSARWPKFIAEAPERLADLRKFFYAPENSCADIIRSFELQFSLPNLRDLIDATLDESIVPCGRINSARAFGVFEVSSTPKAKVKCKGRSPNKRMGLKNSLMELNAKSGIVAQLQFHLPVHRVSNSMPKTSRKLRDDLMRLKSKRIFNQLEFQFTGSVREIIA